MHVEQTGTCPILTYDGTAAQGTVCPIQVPVHVSNAAVLEQVRLERSKRDGAAWEHHIRPLNYVRSQLCVVVTQHSIRQQVICKEQARQQAEAGKEYDVMLGFGEGSECKMGAVGIQTPQERL